MSLGTDPIYRNKFKSKRYTLQQYKCRYKSSINFVMDHSLMMAQSRAESTREINI